MGPSLFAMVSFQPLRRGGLWFQCLGSCGSVLGVCHVPVLEKQRNRELGLEGVKPALPSGSQLQLPFLSWVLAGCGSRGQGNGEVLRPRAALDPVKLPAADPDSSLLQFGASVSSSVKWWFEVLSFQRVGALTRWLFVFNVSAPCPLPLPLPVHPRALPSLTQS